MKKTIFLLLSFVLFFHEYAFAAPHDIHIEWTYDYQPVEGKTLAGYNLYKAGVQVCTTNTPEEREMNCTFDSENGLFTFTLTSYHSDGSESPHSTPYSFTLASQTDPELKADFATNLSGITTNIPFTVSFDANNSTGNISSYSWDFGDSSTSGSSTQTSHTYSKAGTYTAILTVTSDLGATDQKSVTIQANTPTAPINTHNIHLEWTYDYQPVVGKPLVGYYLYKEGTKICTTNSLEAMAMDCTFDSADGTFAFTLTAFCSDGSESPHSAPYTFNLTTPSEPDLIADFTTNPTTLTGDVPFPVSFDSTNSSGNIATYSWNFGDSSSSTSTNPNHTYITTGTRNATLTIRSNSGATSQKSVIVEIAAAPIARINTSPTLLTGDAPFTVSFNGLTSSGNISSYSWDFGDNSSANGSQTSHTYTTVGTHTATLSVTSENGTTHQNSITVTVDPEPLAAIASSPIFLSGDAPFTVAFDASDSAGNISTYAWNFGDNNLGSGQQSSHTFMSEGTSTTTLTITSTNGTTSQQSVTVNVAPTPSAAITTNPIELSGNTPFTVAFDASGSTGNINTYAWNFGDNNTASGSQTSHDYTTAGSFNAILTTTSSNGTSSQESVTITATAPPAPPVATITPGQFSGDAPLKVSFDGSTSTSTVSYAWSFGDGATATASQPEHTFTTAGSYTTTLTVTNSLGQTHSSNTTITVNETVIEPPPTAIIASSTAMGDAPFDISFNGASSHDYNNDPVSSYLWNFGDGSQTSTESITSHRYTTAGTFYPSLTVTDSQGVTNTTSTPVIISNQTEENQSPTARLTASVRSGSTPLEVDFDGSTSIDPEDSLLSYSWNFGDGSSGQTISPTHIYTTAGSFTATLTVTDDSGATSSASTTINAEEETPEFQIELGEVELDHNWVRIDFSAQFTNPVVVTGSPSKNDNDPCVIRLRNITSTGFDIRIQEWTYLDGNHTKETVAYLVIEQGNFNLDDGTLVEAGQFTSSDTNFQTIQFDTAFTVAPVIMTSIATFNEEDTVTGRLQNISTTSFDHKTQEQQLANGHGSETVNYIAWEPTHTTIDNITVIVNKTADKVRNRWHNINFGGQLADLPIFLGTMQSQDGRDPSAIRYTNKTNSGIQIMIEEEQSVDDETRHTSETVGYFLFVENTPPTIPESIKVNFQPETAPTPDGYLTDSGEPFNQEKMYGWVQPIRDWGARDSNSTLSPDQVHDTMVVALPTSIWEIKIPNGTYEITVCIGDPLYVLTQQNVRINGVAIITDENNNGAVGWIERSLDITVTDNRLNLSFAGTDLKSQLCWIIIKSIPLE